ncbi:caffeine-induced death protein 2-domain-containing protein [Kockiozyma suomiensis]|uniref:caffeine-induced death protein 2-domain-containing protein n=1 Tax=Kockiozyma suomiensis TaxID=1337062 RepID=UPI00334411EB
MAAPDKELLSPEECYSGQAIRRFLLLSRSLTDDTVSADLNSMPTVSHSALIGTGTAWSKPDRENIGAPRRICKNYVSTSVFASWKARDDVLEYCFSVANSKKQDIVAETERKPELDPRIDPYAARELPEFTKEEQILTWVSNERRVENIVRDRTWSEIRSKCLDFGKGNDDTRFEPEVSGKWESAYSDWKKRV